MAILKTYTISTDITAGALNSMKLHKEIAATSHVTGFTGLGTIIADNFDILGTTLADETALDALVLAHTITGPSTDMWQAPHLNLGDGATSGVLLFRANSGGILYQFSGVSFSEWSSNIVLEDSNGNAYDGSDLTLIINYIILVNGTGTDDIDWVTEYMFRTEGDNPNDPGTTITETVDVSSRVVGNLYKDTISVNLAGVAGKTSLGISIGREGGADEYSGTIRIESFELIKA